MIVLQVEHNVSSYDRWKKAFDSDPINRKKCGIKCNQDYQAVEDPRYVIIDLYFESREQALSSLKRLRAVWTKVQGTVMVTPKGILDIKESVEL